MVAGSVLVDSLHTLHLGINGKGHQAWEHMPQCRNSSRTAFFQDPVTSEAGEGKGEGKAKEPAGEGKAMLKKMGRTEEESPCECTDPIKKKKSGKKALGGLFGGMDRDHGAVMDRLKKEQRASERRNANILLRGPHNRFLSARKALEGEIFDTEHHYADFRHKQEEYIKAYMDMQFAMKWHCKGIRRTYKGVRFDCERERAEAQNQFFARRHAPECLIGESTPFDVLDESGNVLTDLAKATKVTGHACLPPEVAVLGNLIAAGPTPSRPRQGTVDQVRRNDAAVMAFL